MKLISLNTWHGKLLDELRQFIKRQAGDTDIFCFQEMTPQDAQNSCADVLSSEFSSVSSFKLADSHVFAMHTFTRHRIDIVEEKSLFDDDESLGGALVTKLDTMVGSVWLCNVHGLPMPGSKLDSPERIMQSKNIIDYFADKPGPKIIMGDFNLMPQTESVRMFESAGYNNLIKDFSIRSTRNHYAWDRFPDSKQLFADFTFVSPEVRVKNFNVLNDNVSDHLAMQLEIY